MEGLIPINKRTKQFAIRIAKLYSFSPFPQLFNPRARMIKYLPKLHNEVAR